MKEEHLPEKTKQMMIKGGNGGAKNNLEGGAKSSDGAVAAFDLEAFVKVKFSELEKTAHQKKVNQMLLSLCIIQFHVSERDEAISSIATSLGTSRLESS